MLSGRDREGLRPAGGRIGIRIAVVVAGGRVVDREILAADEGAAAAGVAGNVELAQVDAETLPFADNTFDRVTIAFGLRNVTDKEFEYYRSSLEEDVVPARTVLLTLNLTTP